MNTIPVENETNDFWLNKRAEVLIEQCNWYVGNKLQSISFHDWKDKYDFENQKNKETAVALFHIKIKKQWITNNINKI